MRFRLRTLFIITTAIAVLFAVGPPMTNYTIGRGADAVEIRAPSWLFWGLAYAEVMAGAYWLGTTRGRS